MMTPLIHITKQYCEPAMELMENNEYDIGLVDVPYGIGESNSNHESRNTPVKQWNGKGTLDIISKNYKKKDWDKEPPSNEYFDQLKRVTKDQIIWGANYFDYIVGKSFKPPRRDSNNRYDEFIKQNPKNWIIWDKVNGSNDFSDCELAYTSLDIDTTVVYYMWSGMMQGKSIKEGIIQQGNKKLNEKRFHPTQKPVIIYKWLLKEFAKKGMKILDTHIGSMSIVIAGIDFEVSITGFEVESDYYNDGKKRVINHVSQLSLYKNPPKLIFNP